MFFYLAVCSPVREVPPPVKTTMAVSPAKFVASNQENKRELALPRTVAKPKHAKRPVKDNRIVATIKPVLTGVAPPKVAPEHPVKATRIAPTNRLVKTTVVWITVPRVAAKLTIVPTNRNVSEQRAVVYVRHVPKPANPR